MTVLSVTANDVALLRVGDVTPGEFSEEVEDMADVALPRGGCPWWLNANPRLNGGGS
jgi:hypothetical protein